MSNFNIKSNVKTKMPAFYQMAKAGILTNIYFKKLLLKLCSIHATVLDNI